MTTRDIRARQVVCARCGGTFECGSPTGACWCADEAFRLPMPTDPAEDCLCPACLRRAASASVAR